MRSQRIEFCVGAKVKVFDVSIPGGETEGVVLEHLPGMADWKVHVELDLYEHTWGFHWKQVELLGDTDGPSDCSFD